MVSLAGTQTISGIKTITGNLIANAATITPTQLGYISGLTSNAQTQITACCTLTGVQTISGVKTISATPLFTNATNAMTLTNYITYNTAPTVVPSTNQGGFLSTVALTSVASYVTTNTYQSAVTITIPAGSYLVAWVWVIACSATGSFTSLNMGISTSTSSITSNSKYTSTSVPTFPTSSTQSYSGYHVVSQTASTTHYLIYNNFVSSGTFSSQYSYQLLKIC
jgi:hypothetical protein